MAVTLRDVAERAGVSRSAVSRSYTGGASVAKATRRRIEKAAKELGYSPNVLASSLTTGRTKLIGLVSNNFHNPIFLQVFDQFTKGLQERGLRPLLVNLTDEVDPENSVRMLRAYSVDAVIVASSTLPQSFAQGFRDAGGSSVAVPVRDQRGVIVACVNISGPDSGFDFDRLDRFYIPETQSAALRISRELGYAGR